MGILQMFDKLDDIIYKPIEALSDWVTEPLKTRKHNRDLKSLEKQNELAIKEKTEINRINAEIDEWKKDQELGRMVKVSEAISKYQKELTKVNTDAIQVIGNMQLDLRNKAQEMILDKTEKYKKLQNQATKEAMDDFIKIEKEFPNNEAVKTILYKQIDSRLSNIIDTARDFMKELNSDLANLNKDISKLTEFGQKSVEKLMDKFRTVGNSANLNYLQDDNNIENIELNE